MASDSDVPFESEADGLSGLSILGYLETRRKFIKQVAGTSAAIAIGPSLLSAASLDQAKTTSAAGAASDSVKVNLKINGKDYALDVDPRVTLLDALRERLHLTGSKKGCDHGEELHPMQAAFMEHDGFDCGYCTSGQSCSAVACVKEGHADSDVEIREWMSGNICRCGAYPNILAAIKEVKTKARV